MADRLEGLCCNMLVKSTSEIGAWIHTDVGATGQLYVVIVVSYQATVARRSEPTSGSELVV